MLRTVWLRTASSDCCSRSSESLVVTGAPARRKCVVATAVVAAVDTVRMTTALVHAQAVADVLQAATEVAATIATSAATSPSFARSVERSDDDGS
jgi:hypothetical protein